jgi:16S rRNA (guanine966-N2)-methyltransferase
MELKVQFGHFKGKKLRYPKNYDARPTLARSRDVLFNWCQKCTNWRCLDLFAGTAILGIEALSLGAGHVDFIDVEKKHVQQIVKQLTEMSFLGSYSVKQMDAFKWLKKTHLSYDLIFLDPPFDRKFHQKLLLLLEDSTALSDSTMIFIESGEYLSFSQYWEVLKEKKLGNVRIYLIKKRCVSDV